MHDKVLNIEGFHVIKRIGLGARTVIYMAKDEASDQNVALKRAVLETADDAKIFDQMETEYKVARRIDHPYIRKCHKIIRKRKPIKVKEILLSMEMFHGQSLEDGPSLSLGDILLVFRMVATGLNAMHETGYVHCDIKPNNILISPEGSIKIIDLGQSCKIGAIKTRIQGTPDYIAPEQVLRKHISHRTDIFNFGATMYWALTGKNVPTLIANKQDVGRNAVQKAKCRPPHEIYEKIPEKLSDIVMQCIQQKPADRPANMSEIISRLDVMIKAIFSNKNHNNVSRSN